MIDKSKLNIKVGGDFEALPADKYTAQISDVSLVTQFDQYKGVERDLLNFQFTILDNKETGSVESTRGRLVWQRVSQTLGGRSKLGKLAIAVYGRELTKEEMESFDPEDLIGKQVDVMVVQNPSADGTTIYNNIISVSKVVKKLKAVDAQVAKSTGVVTKKTVPAVAPDAEDPEEFIGNLEKEAAKETVDISQKDDEDEEVDEEAEAAEAELKAAELAAKAARARAEAAKKKAAVKAKS